MPGPGLHVDIPVVAASPDGRYVYYCEQQLSTTDVCHEYLYVVDEHVIKPLTFAGKSLTSDDEDMNFVWSGSRISSNKYLSVSPETPWILTTRE